jgi:hypothetical protein
VRAGVAAVEAAAVSAEVAAVAEPDGVPVRGVARRGVPASSERVRAGVLRRSRARGRGDGRGGPARGRERALAGRSAWEPWARRGVGELCRVPSPSAYPSRAAYAWRVACRAWGGVRLSPLPVVIPCRIDAPTWHRYP